MYFSLNFTTRALACALTVATLAACTQPAATKAQAPKPVKVEVVGTSDAAKSSENFVGTLRARQRSDLGFETPGRLVAIAVEVGDRVRAGQVLARLDESPARWRVDKAIADRDAAAAALHERSVQLKQQEMLANDKIISATALQSARAAHQQARSQLEAADAALATARRELNLTKITAPYDGEVVGRQAQPHSDVASGQTVLQIQAGRDLEVVAMFPDAVASTLDVGSKAQGRSGQNTFPLVLEYLSSRSDSGSLVQAIYRVQPTVGSKASAGLRSGGVVSVELPRAASQAAAITLPVSAILPVEQSSKAHVYVLDSDDKLELREIKTSGRLQPQGRMGIDEGLAKGERVVIAGTAFLHKGQQVAVHVPQTVLKGGQP
ncbi:efflux RND transporter periplasmic adaptor subunit [Comamonas thiooxydans]|uniref:Efflux RND transporter periplasmic adaptor subunit n=1 Tax=Comamonas thiooxydans TaxID=363952 RepID=A0AA42Q4K2_9BURK|nr:efflux RND transporter periplasmic adaptor subunit [Comamonas thiooxydans]MDH1334613.1 efflux RND transporter periplasmic adaptor subunit [Comamonas thiooxydans]MDH1740942.1 efflux RND transporter periplasmic adaptor subunit [Comamonas thiooxydans]MDH1787135.1 efflux RND transporter periplasmic adaptor subunit [Comamonas thiooxydans]